MKKICICTTVSITMKTFVLETAKYLHTTEGYDVTLVCNDDPSFREKLPDYIHFIPITMARGIDFSGFASVLKFIRLFKKGKFDLVQYSTPNAACYASIAARVCRVPIRLYCQWGIRYVGLNGLSRKIFKTIEKLVCMNSTDIRAVSRLNKAFAVEEGLYSEKKAVVIGNGGTIGVDMEKFDITQKQIWRNLIRDQYKIDQDSFVFGFSGRVSADKGCSELLAAFRKLEEKANHIKLFLVGPVEDHCGVPQELIDWARNSKNVVMTGMIDGSQMNQYYAAMDVLVHPTYREGFGMVIQEAGALGVPVITTKVPGASEVMVDGESSIHVEAKNTKELAKAMWRLSSQPGETEKLGKAAYERTRQLYNRPIMLENQRLDYVKLLNT